LWIYRSLSCVNSYRDEIYFLENIDLTICKGINNLFQLNIFCVVNDFLKSHINNMPDEFLFIYLKKKKFRSIVLVTMFLIIFVL